MNEVPKEVLFRHAFQEASKYFAKIIEEERRAGKVAVLVRNLMNSLFFLPCNDDGFPNYSVYNAIYIPNMELAMPIKVGEIPKFVDITAEEIQVIVETPILSNYYPTEWSRKPIVFMWEGRCMNRSRIPIEKLNVQELMRVAQKVIEKREGLILDEATRNKIYK